MALPSYNKENRRKTFEELPKGAYVVKILNAKLEPNKSGKGEHITIAYDIAEGDYKDYFKKIFDANTNEDKKWPHDAIYYLGVPNADSQEFVVTNYDTFMADLEESNGGTVIGDVPDFINKVIGGKFANEQSEYNGNVYDHIKMKWTCTAQAVRDGKAGKLPNDKLVTSVSTASSGNDDFMHVPEVDNEKVPF